MRLIWLLFAVSAVYIHPQVPDYPACDAPPTVVITTPNEERIPPHDGVVDIGSVDEFEELFVLADGRLRATVVLAIHSPATRSLLDQIDFRSRFTPPDFMSFVRFDVTKVASAMAFAERFNLTIPASSLASSLLGLKNLRANPIFLSLPRFGDFNDTSIKARTLAMDAPKGKDKGKKTFNGVAGVMPAGNDLPGAGQMTVKRALRKCKNTKGCRGFTFERGADPAASALSAADLEASGREYYMFFKGEAMVDRSGDHAGWYSFAHLDTKEKFDGWIQAEVMPVRLTFTNSLPYAVEVCQRFDNDHHPRFALQPGETKSTDTYLAAAFVSRKLDGKDEIAHHASMYDRTFIIDTEGTDGSLIYKTSALLAGAGGEQDGGGGGGAHAKSCPADVLAAHNEQERAGLLRLAAYDTDVARAGFPGTPAEFEEHQNRQLRNKIQPRVVPPLTPRGFEKRRIPAFVYDRLKTFYELNLPLYKQALAQANEAAEKQGTDVDTTYMLNLPHSLKSCVHAHLQPVVEEWSGLRLKQTLLYGLRIYTNGAVLDEHVDTLATHVVSLILNVGQEGMEEDWLLTIKDHNGTRHAVTMAPGDMVLYESAKCQHGRPIALKGEGFANMFVHYMPENGWKFV